MRAETIAIIVAGVLALPLFVFVHLWLERCYLAYAWRYCKKHGYATSRVRCGPLFDKDGIKTEYSLVEIDCRDPHQRRILLRLKVWVFGVRQVLSSGDFPPEQEGGANQASEDRR
jgi:hypothetical protein